MRRFVGEARWDIGGQDFRNNGRHFVEKLTDAGLKDSSRILDIGSGCGRIAIPLTRILDPSGSYNGMELSEPLVKWCASHITPKFPNFAFVQCDIKNPLYNPAGRLDPLEYHFPFGNAAFDLIVATSVFTHLLPEIAIRYLRECARVLQQGGHMFATFYFIDSVTRSTASPLEFGYEWGENARVENPSLPETAIGFKLNWVLKQAADVGLEIEPPVRWGSWSGRTGGYSGQDVLIFRRQG
jgi:SAM-dependent methyltransferase